MPKQRANDGWKPRPGSWEEAVEPYEVQHARTRGRAEQREPSLRLDISPSPTSTPRMPATF